jgi:hypothetical protein
MLLPTQQSLGLVANNTLQSMLDGIEEERKKQEEKSTGKERDVVTEAKISASEEAKRAKDKIATALFSANNADPNEVKIKLIDRLADKLGIDTDEARSNYTLGKALEDALKGLGSNGTSELEKDLGLDEMGVSAATLLKAIQNPYGDDNQRLMDGINRKINGGKLDTEVERVVQRLENVADPKTLAELKAGPQGYDPTRIEDAETKAERQDDITAAEAGEKLKDVQKVQDVVEKKNDVATGKVDGAASTSGADAADAKSAEAAEMITLFAAAAEQAGHASDTDTTAKAAGQAQNADAGASTDGDASSAVTALKAEASKSEAGEKAATDMLADDAVDASKADIQPVRVDEIGLYELLKKKLAA